MLRRGGRGFVLASHLYDEYPEDYDARGSGGRYHGVRVEPHAAEDDEERALPRREQAVEVALHREAEAEAGRDAGHYSVNVAYQVALQQDARVVAEGEGRHEGEEAEAACREARAVWVRACDRGRGVCRERNGRRDVGNNRVVEDEEVRRKEPRNLALRMSLLDYYKQTGQDSLYQEVFDGLLYGKDTDEQARNLLLHNYLVELEDAHADSTVALAVFDSLFATVPETTESSTVLNLVPYTPLVRSLAWSSPNPQLHR